MKKVKVQALGTSYADVLSGGAFGSNAISTEFSLDAHQDYTTGSFQGKAKAVTGTPAVAKDIVTARIYSWDASFDHLLIDHTSEGVAEGKLNKVINPD
ncbi:MAG: hypothetical protein ACKO24_13755 [Leptolyngbyaceae cyanobacterium]